jgi:hypothetical protein
LSKEIAIFISNYSLANSPSIINLLDFLSRVYEIDLYLENVALKYGNILKKQNINVIDFDAPQRLNHLKILMPFKKLKQQLIYKRFMNKDYYRYIAIDPYGFVLCKYLFPKSKPLYYSLELYIVGDNNSKSYPSHIMSKERSQINDIKGLIIQSKEKEGLFRKDYGLLPSVPTFLLPVTYKGKSIKEKSTYLRKQYNIDGRKRIALHLGGINYFHNCIEMSRRFSKATDWILFFQGYASKEYLQEFKHIIHSENLENILISRETFKNIDDVSKIIMSCDVGIVWYNNIDIGFRTSGQSSGKIPAYLRFGLPVIANKYDSTVEAVSKTGSGICIDEIREICDVLPVLEERYEYYSGNARLTYDQQYNFEIYQNKLFQFIEG